MNGDFYLVVEVKKDSGDWETFPYMKDATLMQDFSTYEEAESQAKSLQAFMGRTNFCIVRVVEQKSYFQSDGTLIRG